jgi:hypothetical protein
VALRRRLLARGVGGASAVAAAGALVVALLVGGGTSRLEFAEAAVKVAEANSRLLIGEPGWRVVRAAELTVDDGEMTFTATTTRSTAGARSSCTGTRPADTALTSATAQPMPPERTSRCSAGKRRDSDIRHSG